MKATIFTFASLALAPAASAETIYRATTTIDGKAFEDLIVFKERPSTSGPRKPVTGSVTVPGVFSSPLEGEIDLSSVAEPRVRFHIIARERGREFRVDYSLVIHEEGERLTGTLVLPEISGTVVAKKIFEE